MNTRRLGLRALLGALTATLVLALVATGAVIVSRGPIHLIGRAIDSIGVKASDDALGAQPAQPEASRHTAPVTFAVYLNSLYAGAAKSVTGCTTYAELDEEHGVLGPALEPCVIRHGRMNAGFERWLDGQVDGERAARSIGVVGFDDTGIAIMAITVTSPVLIRFATPALDASSISPVYFTSTITGASIRPAEPSDYPAPSAPSSKIMYASTFFVSVDGVNAIGVTTIKPFVFSRTFDGETAGSWTRTDLTLDTAWSKSEPFLGWYNESVLQREPFVDERPVVVNLLARNLSTVLFVLTVSPAGLYRGDAGLEEGRTWTMYADGATVDLPR